MSERCNEGHGRCHGSGNDPLPLYLRCHPTALSSRRCGSHFFIISVFEVVFLYFSLSFFPVASSSYSSSSFSFPSHHRVVYSLVYKPVSEPSPSENHLLLISKTGGVVTAVSSSAMRTIFVFPFLYFCFGSHLFLFCFVLFCFVFHRSSFFLLLLRIFSCCVRVDS